MSELKPYQKRFIIEYRQLAERCEKLQNMLDKWNDGTLDFTPACPYELLNMQLEAMNGYKTVLECRAETEGIDLESYDPMSDMVEALAADLCERETMCNDDPHQLGELDAQTQESYQEEARMDIEAALKAVM